jgi:plasmid stabilization system protein ParE
MKLHWSQEAKDNLDSIYGYYFVKSPTIACRIHNSIIDETERLLTTILNAFIKDTLLQIQK